MFSRLIVQAFGGKLFMERCLQMERETLEGYKKCEKFWNMVDFWSNSISSIILFISACCISAAYILFYPNEAAAHLIASCAFNWLASCSTAFGAMIMFRHVELCPIPSWWPFKVSKPDMRF